MYTAMYSLLQRTQPQVELGVVRFYLLWVVGHVRQHGGHMEHDLVALVVRVKGVGTR